jgi:dipeptidyl aminopeptidase/acylaminoacyl peptidase
MRLALLLALSCNSIFAANQNSFTIEQVLSTAFPSELVAAPAGGRVAWLANEKGVHNVFVASPPEFQPKQLTRYSEDDGQELSSLTWSSDGSALVYVRGEGANGRGENPNPLSKAEGVEQDVFTVMVSGGVHLMGKGNEPAIAPDNKTVAFVNNGQIWTRAIDASGDAAQLIHARGTASALRWSPDGKRLAFTSERVNHSFIGVYDLAAKSLRFLDGSTGRDSEAEWSPDSARLAWLRQPASKYAFAFGPKREGDPWSIRIIDLQAGAAREVWRAKPGAGSEFHAIAARNQLNWMEGDRLVFPYERTGWVHLYSVAAGGGSETDLTPGDFEVEHAASSAKRTQIAYSSNQGDIDRRHIWTVRPGGGAPVALTHGDGLEWEPAITSDQRVVFLESGTRIPAHPAVLDGKAVRSIGAMPAEFPEKQMVTPQAVVFSAADGLPIHGQLFLPNEPRPGKHPAVIFFHGGSRRQMLLGWHSMFYYHQAYGFNEYLASKGYVVLSVNYRSGTGYGLNFREAKDYGATGASEFNDVIGAGLYLRSRGDVDAARVGLWGGSYGGYLTALGLARASDLFAVGVDLHGVHEWNEEITNFVPAYEPEKRQAEARVAFQSSPMAYLSTWKSPVLLIHGDDDRNVNFFQSVILAEALSKQGVHFEELIFPDEIHDFLVHAHWLKAFHAADEFLGRYLME